MTMTRITRWPMTLGAPHPVVRQAGWRMAACLLLLLLALPWWRQTLEARMWTHMMLQLPALACCGAWLAGPPSKTRTTQRWNAHGITGLCFCAVVLSLSMVPRYLDLAVFSLWIDTLKYASFVLCGMAMRHSWRATLRAGRGATAAAAGEASARRSGTHQSR